MQNEVIVRFGAILAMAAIAIVVVFSTASAGLAANEDANRAAGSIEIEPASFSTPSGHVVEFEIGTLYVPEVRGKTDTRLIGVGFARIRCSEQPPPAPPIFILPGGPGSSYLMGIDEEGSGAQRRLASEGERLRHISDIVIVDQRGYSPRGDVLQGVHRYGSERPDGAAGFDWDNEQFTLFAKSVAEQFAKGEIDLAGYTVKECAADVNDLRKALGYETITLEATSFGSQWSFAIMRLYPEIVARALLSGVEPLDHAYDMPSYVFAALLRIWESVEENRRYKRYLPPGGIAEAAEVVIARLEREPIRVEAPGADGETVVATIYPEDFPSRDPVQILELYHGHYARWIQAASRESNQDRDGTFRMSLIGPLIDSSLGVTEARRRQLWHDPATRYIGRDNFSRYLASAEFWPSPDVGDEFRTPVLCEIPVVFAQGDWDLSTPLENTFEIAPFFPNSRVLIAERGGHGVIQPIHQQAPEVWKTLETFLATGDMSGIPARVQLEPSRRFAPPRIPIGE